ncbi:hypothetical protein PV328_012368, partial [Microctonus aethiopoides]
VAASRYQPAMIERVRAWKLEFRGTDNDSVESFIGKLEQCSISCGLTHDDLFRIMPLILRDAASTWWLINKSRFKTYSDFLEALRGRFGIPSVRCRVLGEMFDSFDRLAQLVLRVDVMRKRPNYRAPLPVTDSILPEFAENKAAGKKKNKPAKNKGGDNEVAAIQQTSNDPRLASIVCFNCGNKGHRYRAYDGALNNTHTVLLTQVTAAACIIPASDRTAKEKTASGDGSVRREQRGEVGQAKGKPTCAVARATSGAKGAGDTADTVLGLDTQAIMYHRILKRV